MKIISSLSGRVIKVSLFAAVLLTLAGLQEWVISSEASQAALEKSEEAEIVLFYEGVIEEGTFDADYTTFTVKQLKVEKLKLNKLKKKVQTAYKEDKEVAEDDERKELNDQLKLINNKFKKALSTIEKQVKKAKKARKAEKEKKKKSILPPGPSYADPAMVPSMPSLDMANFPTPAGSSMMTTASIPDMYSYCDFESAHTDARDSAYLDKLSSQFLDKLPNIKVTGGTNRYDNFVNPCHL